VPSREVKSVADSRWVNLLIPGGGLILIGDCAYGVLAALLFTLAASLLLAGAYLFPDDVSRLWRALALGGVIGAYGGAQIRYAQTVRLQAEQAFWDLRSAALKRVRRALAAGRADEAWTELTPMMREAETDLLIAYLAAQVLTRRKDGFAALNAWRRVRRLDRHRIYRQETRENTLILAQYLGVPAEPRLPESLTS